MQKELTKLVKPSCANCEAVCCRDIHLPLNDEEARALRKKGTKLVFMGRPETRGPDVRAVYKMEGPCGFLEVTNGMTKCGIHGPDQPAVCRAFTEAGPTCLKLRSERLKRGE